MITDIDLKIAMEKLPESGRQKLRDLLHEYGMRVPKASSKKGTKTEHVASWEIKVPSMRKFFSVTTAHSKDIIKDLVGIIMQHMHYRSNGNVKSSIVELMEMLAELEPDANERKKIRSRMSRLVMADTQEHLYREVTAIATEIDDFTGRR